MSDGVTEMASLFHCSVVLQDWSHHALTDKQRCLFYKSFVPKSGIDEGLQHLAAPFDEERLHPLLIKSRGNLLRERLREINRLVEEILAEAGVALV